MPQKRTESILVNMKLKSSKGFVVWLTGEAGVAKQRLHGTVEHTGTSNRIEFDSGEALLDFLVATLEASSDESPVTVGASVVLDENLPLNVTRRGMG